MHKDSSIYVSIITYLQDVLWVKNLIGVQISDLSDNCFELAARRCAKFAGNNDKTLNCAVCI